MAAKKLVLIVVDGMTPAAFERAVEGDRAPALSFLAEHGATATATSVFPSLTPVCLSSIVTGAGPDVHQIPHLVWWHRQERRIVEYGSSFAALRAAGMAQSITDTIFNMNQRHLGADAVTVYEALEDAGLVAAAVNITCYRGRHRHLPTLPWVTKAAYGPKRFFYYSLFESDRTGAPLAVRNRAAGSIDEYAAAVGRWLVTRDGFDFFAYYLSDFDYASHAHGPVGADDVALARTDAAIGALFEAAGGPDAFLDRYAVILHSDHGQTDVARAARLETSLAGLEDEIVVTASNRAGQVYLLPHARVDAGELARRLDGEPAVEVTLRREGDEAVARREGEELRFRPAADGWETSGRRVAARPSRRAPPGLVGAREPERRRAARLPRGGLGADRSRRQPPRGRRQPRLARRRRLARADAHGRASTRRPRGSRTSPRPCSGISGSSRRRTRGRSPMSPDFAARRQEMVEDQLRRRGIDDERVLAALGRVPRELFVPEELRGRAYVDAALPIGGGQTISQPFMVALICALLELHGGERVLDVGTGSGYQAAVLAELAAEVHSIERLPELAERARASLAAAGYVERVHVHVGDGTRGLPEHAPFAGIAVAAAAPEPPRSLYEQLERRGRLVVPVGARSDQRLEAVVRTPEGPAVVRSVPCRFVPLLGAEGFDGD